MTFRFSGLLLRFTEFQREASIDAATVGDALRALVEVRPGLKPVLLDGGGQVRGSHRLFLNGEQLLADGLARPVAGSDTVEILTGPGARPSRDRNAYRSDW